MTAPNIYLSDFWSIVDAGSRKLRLEKILKNTQAHTAFLDSLLLHNKILIPTQEYLELLVLLKLYGQKNIINLLQSDIVQFIRLKGSYAYRKGRGLMAYYTIDNKQRQPHPFAADTEDVLTALSQYMLNQHSMMPLDSRLCSLILEKTIEVSAATIESEIWQRTISDIQNNLNCYPEFCNIPDLVNLPSISEAQIYLIGDETAGIENPLVMRLLEMSVAQTELLLAKKGAASDFSIGRGYVRQLLNRVIDTSYNTALTELFKLSEIPDLLPLINCGQVQLEQIIKLRESSSGKGFREWFHINCRHSSSENIQREYIQLLKSIPNVNSNGGKFNRCLFGLAVSAIPYVGPLLGVLYNVIDYFKTEELVNGKSPQLFLQKLEGLSIGE